MTNLAIALAAYQHKMDLEGRKLDKEIGIHQSTLTRLKQGKLPDAEGFAKIIAWMVK